MSGRFLKYWLPVLVWMVVIFTASTDRGSQKHTEAVVRPPVQFINPKVTEQQFQRIHFDVRKSAHFLEYAVLAILFLRAFRAEPKLARFGASVPIALTIVLCAVYANSDEWHQRFVSSRSSSYKDVLIDAAGAVAGVLAFYAFKRVWGKRAAKKAGLTTKITENT